ncbi:hypothetical protein [Methylobacillus sp.]|uniref:hypothetical protein n=1 Tax=Methylobacillus sp. TaxID=56818 RepID=UPI0012BF924B|nr:hypothetical protein [Methylobacillus sp.]MPS49264.1 hypothetical protein [Methylobacillus sp.]
MLLDHDAAEQQANDFASEHAQLDQSAVLMLGILELLHAEHEAGRARVPLAAICKRLGIRMSTLQRLMTALGEQELVIISTEKERLVAALTANGEEISRALQAA